MNPTETRDEQVARLSGNRGYAFLTSEQRNQVNNPVVSVPKPSVSEMGIASTQDATRILKEKQATEARLTTPPPPAPTQPTGATTSPTTTSTTSQPTGSKVTLINPATGQSISYDDASINRENIQQNLTAGYQLESASGAVPSWLTTTSQGTQVAPKTPEQIQKEKDEAVVQKYTDILGNIEKSVANDPALIGMLQNISAQFEQRVKEQEQINKSRNAAISTAGVRLGSRYAGGSAGPMQGIISAQEQAGIDKIAEINSQKTTALIEAKNAFISKKWNEYSRLVDISEKKLAESVKAVAELNKTMLEENKRRQEQQKLDFDQQQKALKDALDYSERIAPMVYQELQSIPSEQQAAFIQQTALKLGIDPNILSGDIVGVNFKREKELLMQENVQSQIFERQAESQRQEREAALALKKFDEDKRQFGLKYALDQQQEARLKGQTPVGGSQPVVDKKTGQTIAPDFANPVYIRARLSDSAKFGDKARPTGDERKSLAKLSNVVGQAEGLISTLKKADVGPVVGTFQNLNPYSFDARAVNSQIRAIVPNVARGVYGEVGVLTDADIANYIQTLPNLKSTTAQNKFVAALTLKNAQRSIENELMTLAGGGINVSGYIDQYNDIVNRVQRMEKELGVTTNPLKDRVRNAGFDYDKMVAAGKNDAQIDAALKAQGK